ncbi:MAG: hypothetical protein ACREAR_07055 [Nitrosotalea sp.]
MKYSNHVLIITLIIIASVSWNGVFAQTTQHYFEIWARDRYATPGSQVTIQGNMCPMSVPDVGTNSSIKIYALGQTHGVTVTPYFLGENNTLPSCIIPSNIITFQTNSTVPYNVYAAAPWYNFNAVAQWTEKGKTITVQSGSAQVHTGSCIGNYDLFSNSQLHPGGMASFRFHVYSFNCKDPSTGVIFTVYNYTGEVKGNILDQESKLVTDDDTLFNFTVPQWTDNNDQFHFLVEINGSAGGFTYLYPVTSSSANNNSDSSTSLVENKTDNQSSLQKQLDLLRTQTEKQQLEKQENEEVETSLHLAEVGIPIAAGISIGMFLFTGKRK